MKSKKTKTNKNKQLLYLLITIYMMKAQIILINTLFGCIIRLVLQDVQQH